MARAQSHSSLAEFDVCQKFREAVTFIGWRLAERSGPRKFDRLFEEIGAYRSIYERLAQRSFGNARVLEIGFGARPNRLIALMSMGIDVRGIDLDVPLLEFELGSIVKIWKANGFERAVKSAVRNLLFDNKERRALRGALEERGYSLKIDTARFLVGDAASHNLGEGSYDLVYSEDVFEHIPVSDLPSLVERLAKKLAPTGVVIISPNVFTGITGGHLPEWYAHLVGKRMKRRSEPWEHIRKQRYSPNTYLNRLSRAAYRELFAERFTILEETVNHVDLGREWLTPDVRADLGAWGLDELLSNKVRFVLTPKPR
jgi:hypothetical protein